MKKIKKIGMLAAGWFIITLGILGLFLPVLQGVLFIMIGLSILSSRSEPVKRLLRRFEERYPQHHQTMESWKKKVTGWFKKGET